MNRQAARVQAPSPEKDSNQDVNQDNEQVPLEAAGARAPPKQVSLPNRRNRPMLSYKGPHRHRRNFNDVNQDHEQVPPEAVRASRRYPLKTVKVPSGIRRDRGPLKILPRGYLLHRSLPEPPLPANEDHIQQLPTHQISENDSLPQCSICLEEMSAGDTRMMLPCLHGFHTDCCTTWLRINGSCPICKKRIEDYF